MANRATHLATPMTVIPEDSNVWVLLPGVEWTTILLGNRVTLDLALPDQGGMGLENSPVHHHVEAGFLGLAARLLVDDFLMHPHSLRTH